MTMTSLRYPAGSATNTMTIIKQQYEEEEEEEARSKDSVQEYPS